MTTTRRNRRSRRGGEVEEEKALPKKSIISLHTEKTEFKTHAQKYPRAVQINTCQIIFIIVK